MSDPRQQLLQRSRELTAELVGDPLIRSARMFYAEVVTRLRARGYPDVRLAHTDLLAYLDREHGTRATDLAERLEVTKQAVGQQVAELERLGWCERVPDPTDGRARLVRITEDGLRVLVEGLEVFAELEADLRARIGDEAFVALRLGTSRALEALEEMTDA